MDEHLLFRYLTEQISDKEKEDVEQWRSSSEENQKIVEQLYFILQLGDKLNVMNLADKENALLNLKRRIDNQNKLSRRRFFIRNLQRVAAILFLPMVLLSAWLLLNKNESQVTQYVDIYANPGVVTSVDLPDGSKVWLNGGSYLRYPVIFKSDFREVYITGQGYFEVAHNPEKPFWVMVDERFSLEVLGTSFNLSAFGYEDIIETTLVEGSVSLNLSQGDKIIQQIIKPNEKIIYSKDLQTYKVSVVDPVYDIAWKNHQIMFKNHSMEDVIRVLERYYNMRFDVKDSKVLEAEITGNFGNEQLVQVLECLKIASGIKYKIISGTTNDGFRKPEIVEIWK